MLRKAIRSPHLVEVLVSYGMGTVFLVYMCLFQFEMGFLSWLYYAVFGSIIYTFLEYWFHRIILHEILDMAHNNHHKWPRNLRIIATPILPVHIYDCVTVVVFVYMLGRPAAYAINCGISVGQIIMDVVHVAFHSHYRPWFLESARSYHLHHHFTPNNVAHGLTTPFWDMIFGTLPTDSWFYYKRYSWARFLQLPFPLVSFILMALLAGETTKTSSKVDQKLADHDSLVSPPLASEKPEETSRRNLPHGSVRSNYLSISFVSTLLCMLLWETCK